VKSPVDAKYNQDRYQFSPTGKQSEESSKYYSFMSEDGSKGKVLEIVTLGNFVLKNRLCDFGCDRTHRITTPQFSPCFSGNGKPGCSQVGELQIPTVGIHLVSSEPAVSWEGPWQSCCQRFFTSWNPLTITSALPLRSKMALRNYRTGINVVV